MHSENPLGHVLLGQDALSYLALSSTFSSASFRLAALVSGFPALPQGFRTSPGAGPDRTWRIEGISRTLPLEGGYPRILLGIHDVGPRLKHPALGAAAMDAARSAMCICSTYLLRSRRPSFPILDPEVSLGAL